MCGRILRFVEDFKFELFAIHESHEFGLLALDGQLESLIVDGIQSLGDLVRLVYLRLLLRVVHDYTKSDTWVNRRNEKRERLPADMETRI